MEKSCTASTTDPIAFPVAKVAREADLINAEAGMFRSTRSPALPATTNTSPATANGSVNTSAVGEASVGILRC